MKQFVRLLGYSGFVPQTFGARTLSNFLQVPKHIDVQITVVESLFSMLVKHYDDAWGKIVISALEDIILIATVAP